mmetsp:Transcript_7785/g.13715  ORF Transcript_7785/g.13715 Transcript_7785/m.13715 type:complete len:148 (+) Transcript_7785:761-1204(+)
MSLVLAAAGARAAARMGLGAATRCASAPRAVAQRQVVGQMGPRTSVRRFGAHPEAKGDPKYNNFKVPHVERKYWLLGEGFGVVMWLWVFYRCKQDGLTVFLGIHPWDLHGDDDEDHGHHDDHDDHAPLSWTRVVGQMPQLASSSSSH